MSARAGVLLGALVFLALSCQLVLGLDRPVPDPPRDASVTAPVDPCAHARPPPRPSAEGESTASSRYWFAGKRVIVPLNPDAGAKLGLDLDDSCTCGRDLRDGAPSCETRPPSPNACDYDGGVDDALTSLAGSFPVDQLFDPGDAVNRLVAEGSRTILFYVERYNGEPDDSDVGLSILTAGGLFSDLGCDGQPRGRPSRGMGLGLNEPGDHWAPAWDGCDRWSPEQGHTIGTYPNVEPIATGSAYVSKGVLVGSIDTIGLTVLGESARVRSGSIVARLTKVDGGFSLAGFVTGRMPFKELVNLVGRTENGVGTGLCESPLWPIVGGSLCSARDIMEDPSRDGKGDPCDAASVAIGFEAFPAQVSDLVYSPPPRVVECDATVTCN